MLKKAIRGIHVVDVHFDETFRKEKEEKLVKFYIPTTLAITTNNLIATNLRIHY